MKHVKPCIAALLAVAASSAFADTCTVSGNYKFCRDARGNTYTVQNYGAQSFTQGSNTRTGSRWQSSTLRAGDDLSFTSGTDKRGRAWNSTTQKIGDGLTVTSGRDSDGNAFNLTAQKIGDYTYYSGTDGDGNPVNYTCGPYGCDR